MKKILVLIVSLILSMQVFALDVPSLTGRVVDEAGILSSSEKSDITNYLKSIEDSTGAQIAVLIVDSLEGDSLEMFSYKTAKEWALGDSEKDNGALLLVSISDRKLRIEVGYGLEGVLTDATSGYIIRNVITPSFKQGNYGEGILNGVQTMGSLVAGDIDPSEYSSQTESSGSSSAGSYFGIIIFIIIIIFRFTFMIGRRRGFLFWGLASTNHHRSSSSFSSGGFSGGGFSGGGGSFGGGGASGGW